MAVFIEWLNQNAYRAYPLKEDTERADRGGLNVSVPDYLMVDFVLTVAGDPEVKVYLSRISQAGGFLSLIFTDGLTTVATLTVDVNQHTANQGYSIVGQGDYEDARGRVVLGDLRSLRSDLPDGTYEFRAELEPGTVRPDLRGVRSLRVGGVDWESQRIFGNIKLIEGTNIQLTFLPEHNGIRVDALDSAGFAEECECEEVYRVPCIRYINGINAENVHFIGDGKCLEITTSGNTIQFRDTCSEPCCGCPELEFITTHLELLKSTTGRLETLLVRLQDRYQHMITAMLASTKGGG